MLRPQDVAVLLRLAKADPLVSLVDLATAVALTAAQVQQSLRRAAESSLVRLGPHRGRLPQQKDLNRLALLELVLHGVRYVYPARLGAETRGLPSFGEFAPTTYAPGALQPVWPDPLGDVRGFELRPLYPQAPRAARVDPEFHRVLACVDALRAGQARERQWASQELEAWLNPR